MANEFIIAGGIALLICLLFGLHSVPEGHIGVYFRGGALISGTSGPGFNVKMPLFTTVEYVQVTVQTDRVKNIPCGTSTGVTISFDKIEVVNRLNKKLAWETIKNYTINYDQTWIFEKIHHEINQFCSKHTLREVYIDMFDELDENLVAALQRDCNKWAPGMEIVAVRVTKPRIPKDIQMNFERMEKEKTNLLVSQEHQKVISLESVSAKKLAEMVAETESIISDIRMRKEIMIKNATQEIDRIDNKIYSENEKTKSEAKFYRSKKQKEIENQRLTHEYLQYKLIGSAFENSELAIGSKIPINLMGEIFNHTNH